MEVVGNSSEIGSVGVDVRKGLGRQPSTSSGGGITSTGDTVSCSNAHVQPPLACLTSAVTDLWKNPLEYAAQLASGALPPANPCRENVKLTCLFCFRLTSQRIQPQIEEDEVKARRNAMLKNLCDQMNLNKDEIPEECLMEMFPFCNGCRKMVNNLWEYKEELVKIQVKMEETVKEIQRKVADGELLQPNMKNQNHPLVFAAEAKKFTRLREMIIKAYREALWMNVSLQHDSCTLENADEVDDDGIAAGNVEPVTSLHLPNKAARKSLLTAQPINDGNQSGPSSAMTIKITNVFSLSADASKSVEGNTATATSLMPNTDEVDGVWVAAENGEPNTGLNIAVLKAENCTASKNVMPAHRPDDGNRPSSSFTVIPRITKLPCSSSAAVTPGSTYTKKNSSRVVKKNSFTSDKRTPAAGGGDGGSKRRDESYFSCIFCAKLYASKGGLMQHLYTHTREKPFSCCLCSMTFGWKSVMINHRRTHTGEKPFKCNVCDKTFAQTSSLTYHYRRHTGERPFKCDVCCKTFCNTSNLNVHRNKHKTDA